MTARRAAALKRLAPYLATLLIVTILLVVGLLRAGGAGPSPSAETSVPPDSRSPAAPTGVSDPPRATVTPGPVGPARPPPTTAVPVLTGTRPPATTTKKGSQIVAWIRDLGLTGGGGSYQEAFIAELSWGQCAELLRDADSAPPGEVDKPTRTLYRAAAQACLAAFDGKPSLWPAADAAVEELSGRAYALDCIDRSAYDLTRTLVKIHRDNPGVVLKRGHTDDAHGPCPRVWSVEPAGGPATGGYQLRITGENLPDPAVIHFGLVTRTVHTSGGRSAVFTVPPVGQSYDVSVWVDGWPFEYMHTPTFTYDPPTHGASTPAGESHGP